MERMANHHLQLESFMDSKEWSVKCLKCDKTLSIAFTREPPEPHRFALAAREFEYRHGKKCYGVSEDGKN